MKVTVTVPDEEFEGKVGNVEFKGGVAEFEVSKGDPDKGVASVNMSEYAHFQATPGYKVDNGGEPKARGAKAAADSK